MCYSTHVYVLLAQIVFLFTFFPIWWNTDYLIDRNYPYAKKLVFIYLMTRDWYSCRPRLDVCICAINICAGICRFLKIEVL